MTNKENNTPIILGITGGIGSGKSYLCHLLTEEYGIPVYDCDTEAKRLNEESPTIRHALTELIGNEVYDEEGHLQRPVLAGYLFQSEKHQQEINAIIHPVVRQDFEEWCSMQKSTLVAMESAILFESGFHNLVDEIITVMAPHALRVERAMKRDGSTQEQVEQRIRLQLSDEERIRHSHHVIINDGRDLSPQIEAICDGIAKTQGRGAFCHPAEHFVRSVR